MICITATNQRACLGVLRDSELGKRKLSNEPEVQTTEQVVEACLEDLDMYGVDLDAPSNILLDRELISMWSDEYVGEETLSIAAQYPRQCSQRQCPFLTTADAFISVAKELTTVPDADSAQAAGPASKCSDVTKYVDTVCATSHDPLASSKDASKKVSGHRSFCGKKSVSQPAARRQWTAEVCARVAFIPSDSLEVELDAALTLLWRGRRKRAFCRRWVDLGPRTLKPIRSQGAYQSTLIQVSLKLFQCS